MKTEIISIYSLLFDLSFSNIHNGKFPMFYPIKKLSMIFMDFQFLLKIKAFFNLLEFPYVSIMVILKKTRGQMFI